MDQIGSYVYDFEIYAGKNSDLGINGDIAIKLSGNSAPDNNFKIYIGNWYSSYKLAVTLKEKGPSTLNRLANCIIESEAA